MVGPWLRSLRNPEPLNCCFLNSKETVVLYAGEWNTKIHLFIIFVRHPQTLFEEGYINENIGSSPFSESGK